MRGTKGFNFGVMLMATSPPLTSGLTEVEKGTRIGAPSVIVVGKQDPWCEEGRRLHDVFWEREKTTLVELEVGHRLPTLEKDTKMIVDEILRLHRETKEES